MILSVSRRTDIPAFYSEWFFNRILAGYLLVRNPMNFHQVGRVSLTPELVDCIVFWSKNPLQIAKRLGELENYSYYFQYTITGYGKTLEPNVPCLQDSIRTFSSLSESVGADRIIWRYDPILIDKNFTIDFHTNNFRNIARQLNGKTKKCIISFVDIYPKLEKTMARIGVSEVSYLQAVQLSILFKEIAQEHNIIIESCAEKHDLSDYGIGHGKCIDSKLAQEISGSSLKVLKDKAQREMCGCAASTDIGAYNTCPHGCLYCYANCRKDSVNRNLYGHDPASPLLFGSLDEKDTVYTRK